MENIDIYIAKDYPNQANLFAVLLLLNIVLLVVGMAAPIITLEKIIRCKMWLNNNPSVPINFS
jgi:hypothetical protein